MSKLIQVVEINPYPCDDQWTAQDESEFRLKWRNEGIDVYNPRNLPSCLVYVKAGLASGLEQRDERGFINFKHWEHPLSDGNMFVSVPLGIDA